MRGKNFRQGMDRHNWPDIEIASLDFLISEGVEISTRGEMVEPLFYGPSVCRRGPVSLIRRCPSQSHQGCPLRCIYGGPQPLRNR
jgi:hypothetical protein